MIDGTLKDGVYELRLAREPCNEIGTELLDGLEGFLDGLEPERAHALVMYSSVRRGFSAGADLRELYRAILDTPAEARKARLSSFVDRIHAVMNRLDALPLTVIGAVHGICFGGGFELALTCDLLVAERTARFCFPELRLGLIPGFGGIPRMQRELPAGVVRDLMLTGRSLNAKRAAALGLVCQMVAVGEGLEVARQIARQATRFDREAARVAKSFSKPIPYEALQREKQLFIGLMLRPEVEDALRRFVESSDPMPYLPQGM